MSMYYQGKEPCQGCGMPGNQVSRPEKNRLCRACEAARTRGLSREHEDKLEYTMLIIHVHAWSDTEIGEKVVSMLREMHNENAETVSTEYIKRGIGYEGSNVWRFNVDKRIAPAVQDILTTVNRRWYELKAEREEMQKEAVRLANRERTKIFNEGVQHGRQLLIQLNNGTISLTDFEKDVQSYHSKL